MANENQIVVSREKINEVVARQEPGKRFVVGFVKRSDGSVRWMNCANGVKKHRKGGERAYDPVAKRLHCVWSFDAGGYRSVASESVFEVHAEGKRFVVEDN